MLPALTCRIWKLPLLHLHQFACVQWAAARTHIETGSSYASSNRNSSSGNSSSSTAIDAPHILPEGVIVLPMPSLSHAMVSGKIKKWLKQEGQHCNMYDLLLEVETETLVEEAYRLDDFAGKVTLLIEANEECYLVTQLQQEGQEVPVGQPIAVLSEEQEGMQQAAQHAAAVGGIDSVYAAEAETKRSIRTLVWQSYLKESSKDPGSSCGCM